MTDPSSRHPGATLDAPPPRRRPRVRRVRGRSAVRTEAVAMGRLLRAVAHPLRLQIIDLLLEHDLHVTGLCERLQAPQAVVSQQLRILRLTGLVEPHRDGGFVRYRLAPRPLRTLARHVGRWGATAP
jgi:ArsR family transcriptional regulator, arsenate/arsenite/antimonite-responsive transcriptional repressor